MPRESIPYHYGRNIQLLDPATVHCYIADCKYVSAITVDGEVLLDSTETLTGLCKEYAGEFIRIHRAALVRVSSVRQVTRLTGKSLHDGANVWLHNIALPVRCSRRGVYALFDEGIITLEGRIYVSSSEIIVNEGHNNANNANPAPISQEGEQDAADGINASCA